MSPYELLDHTADAKFRATGDTLEEAFAQAVQAMTAIAADPSTLDTSMTQHVTVSADNLSSLLFDLLDEILFLRDTEHFLPARADALTIVQRDGKYLLDTTLVGDDARKHHGNLKAVTYSDMIVEEQADGTWLLQAVIDI
jgi:SHS2 domain-containing protein